MFAASYYFIHHGDGWGHLQGNFDGNLLDCAYFSFTTYTTLGMGDIEPIGKIRYVITSYSIHYTKLYDPISRISWPRFLR